MSAQRFAFDVMRSVASAMLLASIHDTRSAVSCCIAAVEGTKPRMALIATVLSVYEYTCRLPVSGWRAASPMVDAASSRSQISRFCLSALVHLPSTNSISPS